jgi:teichuronic acid biosynthesis protein TuaE
MYLQFLLIWIAYAFISTLWAADQIAALKNIVFLFSGISIIFFIVYYFNSFFYLKLLFWLWLLIFIAQIPIGLWEISTGNHLGNSMMLLMLDKPWLKFAPTTIFGNENDFATFIALTFPMVIVWIRYYKNIFSRIFGLFVLLAGLYLLIMTLSRSNYLSVITGFVFWFVFLLRLNKKIVVTVVSFLVGIIVIFTFIEETVKIKETFVNQMSSFQLESANQSNNIRMNLLKNAVFFTANSMGFGVGAGNAEYYMDMFKIYPVGGVTNVHNWWAEILVNYGLIIFFGYILLYITLVFNLWCVYKSLNKCKERMLCEALLVGMVIFFIASFSASSIIAFSPQWIFIGFSLAFINYARINDENLRNHICIS